MKFFASIIGALAAASMSATSSDLTLKPAPYYGGHTRRGGKARRRGPHYGKSDDAKSIRGMHRYAVLGRRAPYPTGGLTHCAQKRRAVAEILTRSLRA